jgi:hypothetical protein
MRIHPVFHVSLLEPCSTDPLPGQVQPPSPPVEVEGDEFYEIEAILDSRFHYRKIQYLVQWKGYDHATWEPPEVFYSPENSTDSNLGALESIREFHSKYPNKPRPRRLP